MPQRRNRRPLTEAERDARRHADRERVEQAARELLTTDGWQRWIRVRASNGLSRYSLRNQWLIALECHVRGITPTYIAGFRAFLALNRCVRKGEKAIKILAPVAVKQRDDTGDDTGEKRIFFRAVPVFDVSMTTRCPASNRCRSRPPRSQSRATATATCSRRCGSSAASSATASSSVCSSRGARRLVRREAQGDRDRSWARQPPGPDARPRARARPRGRLRPVRARASRSARRLRHLRRLLLRRPRRRRRVDPLHRRLGRRRRT